VEDINVVPLLDEVGEHSQGVSLRDDPALHPLCRKGVDVDGVGTHHRGGGFGYELIGDGSGFSGALQAEEQIGILVGGDHLHLRRSIIDCPALRYRKLEFERRMVKGVGLNVALARILAEDQAVDARQILGTVDCKTAARELGLPFPGFVPHRPDAIFGIGVGREPLRQTAAGAPLVHALKGLEKGGHTVGVVEGFARVLDTQVVRLPLIITAEFEKKHADAETGDIGVLPELFREHRTEREPDLGQLLLGIVIRGMARGDMTQLVAENTGQLGLVVEIGENAARHIDVAARHSKGIDHIGIEDLERIGQIRTVRYLGHLLTNAVDVGCQGGIVIEAIGGDDLGVGLLTESNLVALGEQHKLTLSGHRIDGTGDQPADQQQRCYDGNPACMAFHFTSLYILLLPAGTLPDAAGSPAPSVPRSGYTYHPALDG